MDLVGKAGVTGATVTETPPGGTQNGRFGDGRG